MPMGADQFQMPKPWPSRGGSGLAARWRQQRVVRDGAAANGRPESSRGRQPDRAEILALPAPAERINDLIALVS